MNIDVEKERAYFQAIFDGPRTTDLEHAQFEDFVGKGSAPNDWSPETVTSAHYMRRVYEMGWLAAERMNAGKVESATPQVHPAPALEALYVIRDYADERDDAMLHNIVTTAITAAHKSASSAPAKLSDDRIQKIIKPLFADGTCTEEDFQVARAIETEVHARFAGMPSNAAMAALKPFAEAYAPQAEHDDPNAEPKFRAFLDRNRITPSVTVGDFRIAHAVYFGTNASDCDDEQVLAPRYASNAIACAIEAEIDNQLIASGLSPSQMQRQDGHDVWAAAIAVIDPAG